MMKYDRLLNGPIIFPIDQRTLASCAVRPSIYRTKRDQEQTTEVTNAWDGEGGKPASVHEHPKGFGVFVDSRFTN